MEKQENEKKKEAGKQLIYRMRSGLNQLFEQVSRQKNINLVIN
jgi:hypothetical protein